MVLPEGLQFPQWGFWLVHAIGCWAVYAYGYQSGRGAERRARRVREIERGEM